MGMPGELSNARFVAAAFPCANSPVQRVRKQRVKGLFGVAETLFKVGFQDGQNGGELGLLLGARRLEDMLRQVFLQNLQHQAVDRAPNGRYLLEDRAAIRFCGNRAFDRCDLAGDPPDSRDQALVVFGHMGHADIADMYT
jgi:hypothetical protein